MRNKCVWILAGEASGDVYGADLAKELWRRDPDLVIKGMGGVNMRAAGV
ncbi:MAG: lipid-A-disaccharide synthase, partial [Lentisphaeria bacterium]